MICGCGGSLIYLFIRLPKDATQRKEESQTGVGGAVLSESEWEACVGFDLGTGPPLPPKTGFL